MISQPETLEASPPGDRLLAFGDIHGCLDPLQRLLATVAPQPTDRLVFLGDYIDRGPESAGVIDTLLEIRSRFPQTVFLRGNHEQMFLDYLSGRDSVLFLFNGGARTLASYQAAGRWPIPAEHRRFLEGLPLIHETDRYIFVHAGLRPGRPTSAQTEEDLLWIRQDFINSDYDWGKTVVYGHTPLHDPLLEETRIALDTGCVYGRKLTCCNVLTGEFWQA